MGALLNAFLIAIASANFVTTTTHALAWSTTSFSLTCQQPQRRNNNTTRRKWISESISSIVATASLVVIQHPTSSYAITAEGYDNPNYPSPPEERCEHSHCLSFFVIAKTCSFNAAKYTCTCKTLIVTNSGSCDPTCC
jgi:hypothetical protein